MKTLHCKICEYPIPHCTVNAHLINCEARQYGYRGFIGSNSAINWHIKIYSPTQSNPSGPALLYIYKSLNGIYIITEDKQPTNKIHRVNSLSNVLLVVQQVLENQ